MTLVYLLGGHLLTKRLPDNVPRELREFILSLVRVGPLRRPECCNTLIRKIGGLRQLLFGRVHTR